MKVSFVTNGATVQLDVLHFNELVWNMSFFLIFLEECLSKFRVTFIYYFSLWKCYKVTCFYCRLHDERHVCKNTEKFLSDGSSNCLLF